MNNKNIFHPFQGTGTIPFGMSREQVRAAVNSQYKEFRRNQFAMNTSDYYQTPGFFVEYDPENKCEAIEFTSESNLYYEDTDLLRLSYSSLRDRFDKVSKEKEEEAGIGVTYHDLGFGVTEATEGDGVETVIIFSKDYWGL